MKTININFNSYKGLSKNPHGIKNCPIYGDWRMLNHDNSFLQTNNLIHLLTDKNLKIINFEDIAYRSSNLPVNQTHEYCRCCGGRRYNQLKKYSIIYPPILLKGKKYNNFNKEYRMLDGKHRIMKLKEKGNIKSNFYVVSYDEIEEHLKIIK